MKKHEKFKMLLNDAGIIATFDKHTYHIALIQSIPSSIFDFIIKQKAVEVYVYNQELKITF